MSEVETPKRPSILKSKDVQKTAILWVVFTAIIGFVASTVQVRAMGAPASETMGRFSRCRTRCSNGGNIALG